MPKFANKSIYDDILEFSKQQAFLGLLDTGVDVNFFEPVLKQLNSSVFNGGNIDDLLDELKIYITGGTDGVGALQRYVTQVSNDSLSQFNATYNQTITQDLGYEFYVYTGTIIAGTRPFCNAFVNQYFHKKEVEKLGEGINPITNKSLTSEQFKGRAKGTNKSTIFTYRGGYNCRHFFSPISERFVPKSDLLRNINNGNWKPSERQKKLLEGKDVFEEETPIDQPLDNRNEFAKSKTLNLDNKNKLYRGDIYDKGNKFSDAVDYVDSKGNAKNKGYNFFSDDKEIAKSYALSTDRTNIKLPNNIKIKPNITEVSYSKLKILDAVPINKQKNPLLQDTYSFLSKVNGKNLSYDEVSKLYGFETRDSVLNAGFKEAMWEEVKKSNMEIYKKMTGEISNDISTWSYQGLSNFENGVHFKEFLKKHGFDGYRFIDGGGVGGIDYAIFNNINIENISKEFIK